LKNFRKKIELDLELSDHFVDKHSISIIVAIEITEKKNKGSLFT